MGACAEAPDTAPPPTLDPGPDVAAHLACLEPRAALTVAHRGTDQGSPHPENSLAALEALLAHGIRAVEIDVAQTRDGVAVLFHDGVWEKGSDGTGAVAATPWRRAQTLNLRAPNGRITGEGVARLEDYLAALRGRGLAEVDFKTSADYAQVIEIVERSGMERHVILIAYSVGAARRLRQLAPRMWISVPPEALGEVEPPALVWNGAEAQARNAPVVAAQFGQQDAALRRRLAGVADLLVTDTALRDPAVVGMDAEAFGMCLGE